MGPFPYRDSHYENKTVSRPSYSHTGIPIFGKMVFILRWGPDLCSIQFTVQYWSISHKTFHIECHKIWDIQYTTISVGLMPEETLLCLTQCVINDSDWHKVIIRLFEYHLRDLGDQVKNDMYHTMRHNKQGKQYALCLGCFINLGMNY